MTWPAHDEFSTGSTPGSDWADFNPSTGSTRTVSNGFLRIFAPNGSGGWEGVKWAGVDDSSPWIETLEIGATLPVNTAMGIALRESSTGRMLVYYMYSNSGTLESASARFTGPTAAEFFTFDRVPVVLGNGIPPYWRVQYDGTDYVWLWSIDGYTWSGGFYGDEFSRHNRTTWLTSGADELLVLISPSGGGTYAAVDWVRPGSDVSDATWLAPAPPPTPPTPPDVVYVPPPAAQIDHVALALSRLLQQFKGERHPLIQKLVAAALKSSNRLEAVLWVLLLGCQLDNAVGAWLDEWGAILGLERAGWDDDRYRELLYAQLYVLRSSGTVEQIYRVMTQLDAAWVGGIDEFDEDPTLDPASFRLEWTSPVLDDSTAELYRRFLRKARAAGVRVWFYSYPDAEENLFTFAPSGSALVATNGATQGFGDMDDTEGAGGGLAREVIA